jgi:chemotaxis protein methyltransferase CheR
MCESFCLHLSLPVTEMFRDPDFFLELRQTILPQLHKYSSIHIWHAGCATGEEVLSLSIILFELGLYSKCHIYATDINPIVLNHARKAIYPIKDLVRFTRAYQYAGGSQSFGSYYLAQDNGTVKFDPQLLQNVTYSYHNLITDERFSEFHLILCRNVLIYFNHDAKDRILTQFCHSLHPSGFLCLGYHDYIQNLPCALCPYSLNKKIYARL